MYDSIKITKSTDQLKKLIAEHPDYPIAVFAGEEANIGDCRWMFCSDITFSIEELLDCEFADFDDSVIKDRDRLEEFIAEQVFDENPDLTGDAADEIVKARIAEFEPYWKNVICIWATN